MIREIESNWGVLVAKDTAVEQLFGFACLPAEVRDGVRDDSPLKFKRASRSRAITADDLGPRHPVHE